MRYPETEAKVREIVKELISKAFPEKEIRVPEIRVMDIFQAKESLIELGVSPLLASDLAVDMGAYNWKRNTLEFVPEALEEEPEMIAHEFYHYYQANYLYPPPEEYGREYQRRPVFVLDMEYEAEKFRERWEGLVVELTKRMKL